MVHTRSKDLEHNQSVTISEAVQTWQLEISARNYTRSTQQYYAWYLGVFGAWLTDRNVHRLSSLTANHLRQYQTFRERAGWDAYTLLASFRAIRARLNFCVIEGWLEQSPAARAKAPETPKDVLPCFSRQDVRRLLAVCEYDRETALVLFLLDTGARAAEAVAVNVGDVDIATGVVLIRNGKGRRSRTVYLGAKSRKAMLRYHVEADRPSPRFLHSTPTSPNPGMHPPSADG